MAVKRGFDGNKIVPQLAVCGAITLIGYIGLFCLMQTPVLWYDLRADPVRSVFPSIFAPINQLFPDKWVNLQRAANFALVLAPLYVTVTALITAPLLYLLRRVSRLKGILPRHERPILLLIFGFTLAIMLVLLFLRGLLSSDVYNYEWYSRIWVAQGVSPYTHVPVEFTAFDTDGSISWIGWPKQVAVYGPAWLLISSAFYKLGQYLGNTFSTQLFALRLLADGAHLLNAWLVWNIAGLMFDRYKPRRLSVTRLRLQKRLHRHRRSRRATGRTALTPESATAHRLPMQVGALLFYIWNPLALVEFAGSGHNDVVMLTFVLLALWCYLKGWWPVATLALGVATLVKLPAAMFVPGYLWLLLWDVASARRAQGITPRLAWGAWRAIQAGAILLVAWVVFYLPFWEGARTLQALVSGPAGTLYLHSIPAVIWTNVPQLLANLQGDSVSHTETVASVQAYLGANLKIWAYILLLPVAIAITWRARTFRQALTAWGWLAIAVSLAQIWFWPWYVTWALVPATFSASRRLRTAVVIFSVSALFNYMEEQVLGAHFSFFLDWSGALITLPLLVYLLGSWLIGLIGRRLRRSKVAVQRVANPVRSKGLSSA